ncbi:MAG: tetratricopeptide repeat protein [Acidobacteriota bacterium]|nr:tetratricopeptide repeat protein [Acidobacteriota bacterium]
MKLTVQKILPLLLLTFAFAAAISAQDYLPELVRRIKPSAVAIETFDAKGAAIARGSGFFVANDKIITNRHVIEKSNRVEIHLIDGRKITAKGVLAIDGEGDLALLQVEVPPNSAVAALPLVQTAPQEGESIVVIGNPFGLEGSVSNGIVSAVREIPGYGKIIQITAPISPGSSGSPVVNMRGQVIGVATLQAAEGQSINFAVPSARITQLKISDLQSFASLNAETLKNKRAAAQNLYSQGLGILSRDDYAKAVGYFEKAVEIDPNYAEGWYQIGFCYGMLGKPADALKASRQAAKLRPDWAETYINIGASSFALGQYKDAADAYRQAAKLDDGNAETLYALGLSLGKLGRADEGLLAYKRAVAIKPDLANAWEQLGAGYFKQKRYTDSLAAFEQLKIYQPDAKTYNYLGENYYELGRIQDSVDALNNAVAYNPDSERARFNLGKAYVKLGDTASASVQYEILRNNKSDWADRLYVLINP